jgi:hypothetical protein
MLTFPDLGSWVVAAQRLTQILQMSVELHNVPGNLKPVNSFLGVLSTLLLLATYRWMR